ncbi:VOC family protein, partial [Burkholderia multivorans]
MDAKLRGVFLTCGELEDTADFYRDIAGLELSAAGDDEYTYYV